MLSDGMTRDEIFVEYTHAQLNRCEDLDSMHRTVKRMKTALEFLDIGGDGIVVHSSCVIIDGKFEATLLNRRWRQLGKKTWYHYGSVNDLLHKLRGTANAV